MERWVEVDVLIIESSNKANAEFPRNESAEETKQNIANGEDVKEQEGKCWRGRLSRIVLQPVWCIIVDLGEEAEECFETNWD